MDNSKLFDEKTFYSQFLNDLVHCQKEVYIESPFITCSRMKRLYSIIEKLIKRNVKVYIVTRNPKEHLESMEDQAEFEIQRFERLGVQVFLCIGNHHRKLAILDRKVLWEGSLNILSQTYSRELMRRTTSEKSALEMFNFLRLDRII
ncbi:MAG TPA: phospholipase D-like domain-containing protein [Methylomirabilota bacterium]|nr:phospholipase D-like domain-containing protein [Methylomirabilota bacterium]